MPLKREIQWPYFLECTQFCDDIFWENIFEELAYGKAPFGTYISKGFLTCSYKGKEFSYKIQRKEPEVLYNDIYKLLTEKIGILSHKEKAQKKLVFHELERTIKESRHDWASIRRKNIKDTLYEKYVIDMKLKYSLSPKQCKYLLSAILISIMFKTITTKDIEYKDDKIQNIEGLEFSKGKIILKRPLCSLSSTFDNSEVNQELTPEVNPELTPEITSENSKYLSENWEKYLNFLRVGEN
jgi:hypothetical protein